MINRKRSRVEIGRLGEEAAAAYLAAAGYRIHARNWRCKAGELDIAAEHNGTLVIVEVRTRTLGSSMAYGTAAESIDARKAYKVRIAAEAYIQAHKLYNMPVRVDAMTITLAADGTASDITHLKAVF
ncbi:YraN family protein [Paenibacillus terricola]|uniref:YraN family protein n=1 Tax=Paenibacillus terricola TaxID=2763503 RepID=UPI001CD0B07E|nr:YraN family protein [Paenibacillus terricola]